MPSTVPEPMNLDTIAKIREELHAYIGERWTDRSNRQEPDVATTVASKTLSPRLSQESTTISRKTESRVKIRHASKRSQSRQ